MAHPLRVRILIALNVSPSTLRALAERLHHPLTVVRRHVQELQQCGLVADTDAGDDAVLQPLAGIDITSKTLESYPEAVRAAVFSAAVREWTKQVIDAVESGGFDHPESVMFRAHFAAADPQGAEDIHEAVRGLYGRLAEIEREIAARHSAEAAQATVALNVGLILFEAERQSGWYGPAILTPRDSSDWDDVPLIPEQ